MSCLLNNAIETAWSKIKQLIHRKQLTELRRHRTEGDFYKDVKDSMNEAVIRHHESLLKAGNKYILQYLRLAQVEEGDNVMVDEPESA